MIKTVKRKGTDTFQAHVVAVDQDNGRQAGIVRVIATTNYGKIKRTVVSHLCNFFEKDRTQLSILGDRFFYGE